MVKKITIDIEQNAERGKNLDNGMLFGKNMKEAYFIVIDRKR